MKLLQHELKHVHALKRDVEAIQQVHDDMKRRDTSNIAEMNSKMQDLRRDMQLQDVRLDKTHMHIVDIRKKMEM